MNKYARLKKMVVFSYLLLFCSYTEISGWTIDRLASGQLSQFHKNLEYLDSNYPNLSPLAIALQRDCTWGLYFKIDQADGNKTPMGGLILRF